MSEVLVILYHHPEYWRVQSSTVATKESKREVELELELGGFEIDCIGDTSDPASMFELGLACEGGNADKVKIILENKS